MTAIFAGTGGWLLLQAAHPDTVWVQQVGGGRSTIELIGSIASSLMTIAVFGLAIALVPAAWKFRKIYGDVRALIELIHVDIKPLIRNMGSIADNVNYITTSVRSDVQQVQETITAANERLQQAVALTEHRLNEFNALLAVVQQEAETMFVATASTVRGVRAGASSLHHEDDELDAIDASLLSSEELEDGYDDPDAPETGTTRPRVRPRRRGYA